MRKLLLICVLAALSVPALAANEYTAVIYGEVTVKDKSFVNDGQPFYEYEITFTQAGTSDKTYYSEVYLHIYPSGPSIAGTYRLTDYTLDGNSYVQYGDKVRYATDYTPKSLYTEITIADNGIGTYTLSGAFRTKKDNNYYYYYYSADDPANTFIPKMADPFDDEPEASEITFNGTGLIFTDDIKDNGCILVDINDDNYNIVELAFNTDEYDIPAGSYAVSDSGAKGSIKAATGEMDAYYPKPSFAYFMDDSWNAYNYFITGGSVEVSYSQDKAQISVSGTVTTAHGSEIAVAVSGKNPFYREPEPETFVLSVSGIETEFVEADKPYFTFMIEATNKGATCNGYLKLNNISSLPGTYDYNNIDSWSWFGDYTNSLANSMEHSVKITAAPEKNEYRLSLDLICSDNNHYVIKDAPFTYVPPEPPGPFDAESDYARTIEFETSATPYVYDDSKTGDGITLKFYNADYNCIYLTFAVSTLGQILPGRYVVDGSKSPGTIIASEGRKSDESGELYESYSFFGEGFTEDPYYITEGFADVTFTEDVMKITGEFKSFKGSVITVDINGANSGEVVICSYPLPLNVMNGYILKTDATYMLAYDVFTNSDGSVAVALALSTDKAVAGLQPQIKAGDAYVAMSLDAATGEYVYTVPASEVTGPELDIELKLVCAAGETPCKTISYTVEK